MSGVAYPVATDGARLVWARDLAAANERPPGLRCVSCAGRFVLRVGSRRPHFAHHGASTCARETALHVTTIAALREALEHGMRDATPVPVRLWCEVCREARIGNLAKHTGGSVDVNKALSEARPDLLVRDAQGRARFVVEVIVTHEPEPAAMAVFERARLPVVRLWPMWDVIEDLRGGLVGERFLWRRRDMQWQLRSAEPQGWYDVVGARCLLPGHDSKRALRMAESEYARAEAQLSLARSVIGAAVGVNRGQAEARLARAHYALERARRAAAGAETNGC